MKGTYNFIFVVLVYKNTDVLLSFFENLNVCNSKVIVVNSYYDKLSSVDCRNIAVRYNADFIECENKGYGYGNNIGINYAMSNYSFNYLIVSNSDIIIKDLNYLSQINIKKAIIAPETRMLTGKRQNPDTPWKLPFIFELTNIALKYDKKWLYFLTHVYTRLSRELFFIINLFLGKELTKIFSAHGSFFIVTELAIKELYPLFDDRMFLYNEEWYMAMKARYANVPILYCPKLKVLHLEGASSDNSNNSFFKFNKQSFTILYNWIKIKE